MPKLEKARNLLVIRPWIASYSSSETFGHFDGLVMRQRETATPRHYCDLEVLHAGDDPVVVSIPVKKGAGEAEEGEAPAAA